MHSYLKTCRMCGDVCDGPEDICLDCDLQRPRSILKLCLILLTGIIISALIVYGLDRYPEVEAVRIVNGEVEVVER